MNLYGWTTWWERVCRHERIKKISISETNQSAKLSFLSHFSSRALVKMNKVVRTEKEFTPGSVDIIGSTTPKRLREEDSLLTGEIQTKFQKKEKMSFSEIQNFWDCGGGDTATNSSMNKMKIYRTMELAKKPDLDLD